MNVIEKVYKAARQEQVTVVEHKPAAELISPVDIVRTDALGRTVVIVPAGQPVASWVRLSDKERGSLVEPPEPRPEGHLHPIAFGFSPEGVRVGFTIETP